jgi:hypothetical protein
LIQFQRSKSKTVIFSQRKEFDKSIWIHLPFVVNRKQKGMESLCHNLKLTIHNLNKSRIVGWCPTCALNETSTTKYTLGKKLNFFFQFFNSVLYVCDVNILANRFVKLMARDFSLTGLRCCFYQRTLPRWELYWLSLTGLSYVFNLLSHRLFYYMFSHVA